jgi:ribonuclease HI
VALSEVVIYCDGACLGNPGPGGYAALLMLKANASKEKIVSGYELATTNNRMELRAAIEGLKALSKKSHVTIFSDSLYLVKGMTEWMRGWEKSGFKNAQHKNIANIDLWQNLEKIAKAHFVSWRWIKGHAGHKLNERVDEIAKEQAGLALHYLKTGHF